jgi:hypothetical protein
MKKIIILSLGLISLPLISALEPLSPADKQKLGNIKKELKTIADEVNAEYKLQADEFKSSSQETIAPVKFLPEQRKRLKNIIEDLDIFAQNTGNDRLLEFAKELRSLTLKSFNAAEAINNNIEDALGDSPRRDAARKIVADSIEKLSSFSLDFNRITTNSNQYDTAKFTYRDQAAALRNYAHILQYICDRARASTQLLMKATATKSQPKKSKNIFKRIFGS